LGRSAKFRRFLEKNRAAKRKKFLIHSRGRVETTRRRNVEHDVDIEVICTVLTRPS
jgi:hypothetical protein